MGRWAGRQVARYVGGCVGGLMNGWEGGCMGGWMDIERWTHLFLCGNIRDFVCILAALCPPGMISQSGLVPCLKCPLGYNQALEGHKFCYSEIGEHIGVECLLLPCLNGGSCYSLGPGFFTCECSIGFIGRFNDFPYYPH